MRIQRCQHASQLKEMKAGLIEALPYGVHYFLPLLQIETQIAHLN